MDKIKRLLGKQLNIEKMSINLYTSFIILTKLSVSILKNLLGTKSKY